ncbi:unnamed protein product [Rotaria magnacalcarata]|uniref:YTH domain-containing protein n=2 Tax=Rotaria magnacalcarata TaxID=392030 RepID=A0A814Y768_9BILA|nr:unnamed protein product [Rotaria magnacalcarata]CAF3921650.1 unnamed protein product [Rotaria magnacalcarata]
MINEHSSAQANTPASANMQYGYPTNHYDMMSMAPMQNPNDVYSYYPPSLYQPFGAFDDHSQWGTADTSGNVPQHPPGPMQFHPQMYTPSPIDMPRSPFEYPAPHHAYPHYHPGFTPSTFPGPPSTGTSAFDMSWNPHSLSMQQMQVAAQQQMTPIGAGPVSNKKISVYDEYPAGGVGDMLAQHMSAVDLGNSANNDDTHNYDNGAKDNTLHVNALSSKEQHQHYQSNSSNLSLSSRPSQVPSSSVSSGPKSYASVVSSDTINTNNNKLTQPINNIPARSTVQSSTSERNNTTSNFSNDSNNSRSNTNVRGNNNNNNNNNNNMNNYSQQTRNGSSGYNSRNQQQQQQQQQSSGSGSFLNWTNSSSPSNSRGNNSNTSSNYYNSGSSNYYDRSSYSQQQQTATSSNNNTNKRSNLNYQQNYSSSRTTSNMSNGSGASSAIGQQQPLSAANQEFLDNLKRNHQYNPKDFNLNPKGARFFVIKSYSEDDVHRSIKYNIWCSTEHGNKRLDAAFREREGKGPIYLFYSVNASGHFCGMAEMMSPLDYEHQTDVWQMSNKWQGKFEVKWIYVKDVPNQQFRNIRLENNDNKPVTNSRDTQEIPYEKGKLMLKTMHLYRDKTSIFDDFQYYESKQAEEVVKKPSTNDFINTNPRGNNNNKRQYSSNKTPTDQQQQHQTEDINNEDIQ